MCVCSKKFINRYEGRDEGVGDDRDVRQKGTLTRLQSLFTPQRELREEKE